MGLHLFIESILFLVKKLLWYRRRINFHQYLILHNKLQISIKTRFHNNLIQWNSVLQNYLKRKPSLNSCCIGNWRCSDESTNRDDRMANFRRILSLILGLSYFLAKSGNITDQAKTKLQNLHDICYIFNNITIRYYENEN
jgi:hypothetical protein